MKLSSIALVGLLASQGAHAQLTEEWVVQLHGKTPRIMSVRTNIEGAVCKVLNKERIYIVPSKQVLPGTDTFRDLNSKQVKMIINAPSCPSKKEVVGNKKGLEIEDL